MTPQQRALLARRSGELAVRFPGTNPNNTRYLEGGGEHTLPAYAGPRGRAELAAKDLNAAYDEAQGKGEK